MNYQAKFIISIHQKAINACRNSQLYPSLMIAQAILESNWGRSSLSKLHHNYFGIKANITWVGNKVTYSTTEFINDKKAKLSQAFRSYPSIDASFADRVNFLRINKRYTINGVFSAQSPEQQALAFLKAGYATDPRYLEKLISIINKYKLKQYDK